MMISIGNKLNLTVLVIKIKNLIFETPFKHKDRISQQLQAFMNSAVSGQILAPIYEPTAC